VAERRVCGRLRPFEARPASAAPFRRCLIREAGTHTVDGSFVGAPGEAVNNEEANMAGMIRKLIASGVAAKVLQEARKPQNQAKLKKMLADFQNKQKGGGGRTRGY
jgi:hypothetical protein